MTDLEALITGQLLGLLIYQREKQLSILKPHPLMNGDDYTNVIEMKDHMGIVRCTITVEEIEPPLQRHGITYGVSNSATCSCGKTFHGVVASDLDEQVDAHEKEVSRGS